MQIGAAGSGRHLERYALSALLVALVATFMINFAFLSWQFTGEPVFAFTTAITAVAIFALRLHMTAIADRDVRAPVTWRDWMGFTLPALAVVRILTGAFVGLDPGAGIEPLFAGLRDILFSLESLVLFGALSAAWFIAAAMADSVNSLCYVEDKSPPPRDTADFYTWQAARALVIPRHQAVEQIRIGALMGAILVATIAAILILLPTALRGADAALIQRAVQLPVVFAYFLFMFATLSFANYARNRAGWSEAGTSVSDAVAPVWLRTSALVVGLGLLVASSLPAFFIPNMEYFGGYLLKGVVIAWQVVTLPLFLVMAVLSFLASLLFGQIDEALTTETTRGQVQMFGQTVDSITYTYLQGLFVFTLLTIALYYIYRRSFATGRPGRRSRYMDFIRMLLAFLWSLLRSLAVAPYTLGRAGARAVAERIAAAQARSVPSAAPAAATNLDRLWEAFAEVIAAAERVQVFRPPSLTAREFGQRLIDQLGIEPGPVAAAADAFNRARYDPRRVSVAAVEDMRALRDQICSAIEDRRGDSAGSARED